MTRCSMSDACERLLTRRDDKTERYSSWYESAGQVESCILDKHAISGCTFAARQVVACYLTAGFICAGDVSWTDLTWSICFLSLSCYISWHLLTLRESLLGLTGLSSTPTVTISTPTVARIHASFHSHQIVISAASRIYATSCVMYACDASCRMHIITRSDSLLHYQWELLKIVCANSWVACLSHRAGRCFGNLVT